MMMWTSLTQRQQKSNHINVVSIGRQAGK